MRNFLCVFWKTVSSHATTIQKVIANADTARVNHQACSRRAGVVQAAAQQRRTAATSGAKYVLAPRAMPNCRGADAVTPCTTDGYFLTAPHRPAAVRCAKLTTTLTSQFHLTSSKVLRRTPAPTPCQRPCIAGCTSGNPKNKTKGECGKKL